MKAYVQFPSSEGMQNVEIHITLNSEFSVASKFNGEVLYNELGEPIIVVKDIDVAEQVMMSKRDDFHPTYVTMDIVEINNLISLVTMTVDELHRGEQLSSIDAMEKHLNNTELYGDLPKEVKDHIIHVVTAINNHINDESIA